MVGENEMLFWLVFVWENVHSWSHWCLADTHLTVSKYLTTLGLALHNISSTPPRLSALYCLDDIDH